MKDKEHEEKANRKIGPACCHVTISYYPKHDTHIKQNTLI